MDYSTKARRIFEKHGYSEQLKKLSEETFELQEAVINYFDYLDNCEELVSTSKEEYLLKHIEEELADVEVVLIGIRNGMALNDENILKWEMAKIDRQCKRDEIRGEE